MRNPIKKQKNDCMPPGSRRYWLLASRSATRSDRGQALVELALTLPLCFLLLVGAAEFGRLAYLAIEVANAARAGAAYGAQTAITASDTAGIALAATQDAPNVTGISATSSTSCVCSTGGALVCTNALASCASPARILEYVTVNTTATVGPLFNYPGLPHTFTLSGQTIMRVEQ
ncbi:MAG: TadE/TadG family type IV pilus assembly protein [Acidobacteriaceae bacterium]